MEDGEKKVKMTIDGQEIFITLYDTTAANALYDILPLELSFEDYNGVEKISYLSQTLSTRGEPDGYDPAVGDLCFYETDMLQTKSNSTSCFSGISLL